jgi:hypothetical protein
MEVVLPEDEENGLISSLTDNFGSTWPDSDDFDLYLEPDLQRDEGVASVDTASCVRKRCQPRAHRKTRRVRKNTQM